MKVNIVAEYAVDVSQKDIDYMKKHTTDKSEDMIAQDLAKASIEAHKEQPHSMEAKA